MSNVSPVWTMIGLNLLMLAFTLWVLSMSRPLGRLGLFMAGAFMGWLLFLHLGLTSRRLFAENISGVTFLLVIFAGVGLVGCLVMLVAPVRRLLFGLSQQQLLLLQGIRVFFGATFLMHASTGVLPQTFGIVDGLTHVGAGFFGLVAAFSLAAGVNGARRAWFANFFGLADILIVAGSLALVLLPEIGPHHPMMYAVFLPAPLWVWFHAISVVKLLRPSDPAPSPTSANRPMVPGASGPAA